MFEVIRSRWNAAKERRLQKRAVEYLRANFSEVMGSDARILDGPDPVGRLFHRHFGGAA